MSPRSSEDRYRDILDAAERALRYLGDRELETFMREDAVIDGVAMCVLRIGESVARLRDAGVNLGADHPWSAMIGMRNVIAHGYHRMAPDELHRTVRSDLPQLILHVRSLLVELDGDDEGSDR